MWIVFSFEFPINVKGMLRRKFNKYKTIKYSDLLNKQQAINVLRFNKILNINNGSFGDIVDPYLLINLIKTSPQILLLRMTELSLIHYLWRGKI